MIKIRVLQILLLTLLTPLTLASQASRAELSNSGAQVDAETKNTVKTVDQDDASILQRHYPFYFAYGHGLSKLQLSFKTPLVRTWPLYFGYTQLLFWALNDNSKPFRDLTYNPELFYRWSVKDMHWLKSIDFGFFSHNSNGKAGLDSRSFNKSYLRANFERAGPRWLTRFSAQVSDLYDFDETNHDIQDYIGPLALNISFIQLFESWVDKSEVALQFSPGGKFADRWDRGGYQLSWAFRLGGIQLVPAFYLQYYNGYAETLLNYNKRVDVFRGGLIF